MSAELTILRDKVFRARNTGSSPRVHGNGFVQLDLEEGQRMHIFGDARVRPQLRPSTIHDHTLSFKSRVYKGQLVHRTVEVYYAAMGPYRMYRAVTNGKGEDRRLESAGHPRNRFHAIISGEHVIREGETYNFSAGRFHETLAPWLCVTVVNKTEQTGTTAPRVLVPHDISPDEGFNRYQFEEDLLWKIIFDAIAKE